MRCFFMTLKLRENCLSDLENNDDFMEGLITEYIDSSLEGLSTAQDLTYQLKTELAQHENIKEIFRVMHSLKGSSAIVGCLPVRNLAHSAEFMLEKMQSGTIHVEDTIVDLLTATIDVLISLVETFGNEEEFGEEVKQKVEYIISELDAKSNSDPRLRIYGQLFEGGLFEELKENISHDSKAEAEKNLSKVMSLVQNLFSDDDSQDLIDENVSLVDELREIDDDTDFTEGMFKQVLQEFSHAQESAENQSLKDKYSAALEQINQLYEVSGASEFLAGIIVERYDEIDAFRKEIGNQPQSKSSAVREKTMRVPETSLDDFIQFIGDLIIVREMIDDSRKRIEKVVTSPALNLELKRHMDTFSITLSKLEGSAMSIRKQSIHMLMNKMSRLAREIAGKTSKLINMNNEGSEVQIDKSLLELIEAPMIHIINNAVDHGIEAPEERLELGKAQEGVIAIKAVEEEETIVISISDDGKGMNFDALLEKGKKMGLANDNSSHEELLNLIFMPGFSTASAVTDISGRGVGMDVVRKELEKAGGSIEIRSEVGKGSTFTLTLPKSITTQIIQGYNIEVAGEPFIIPVKAVRESLNPDKVKIAKMYDTIECLELRGEIMPVIKVAEHLYNEDKPRSEKIYVIVEETGRNYALLVDKVIGIQQVVLKELRGMKMNKNIFTGAALMGNGDVALVLDISAFLSSSSVNHNRSA